MEIFDLSKTEYDSNWIKTGMLEESGTEEDEKELERMSKSELVYLDETKEGKKILKEV